MSKFVALDQDKIKGTLRGVKVGFGSDGSHLLILTEHQGYFDLVTRLHCNVVDFTSVISVGDTAEFSDILDDEDDEYAVSVFMGVGISSDGTVLFEDSQGEVWSFIRPLTNRRDIDIRLAQEEVDQLTADLNNARAKLEALQKNADVH